MELEKSKNNIKNKALKIGNVVLILLMSAIIIVLAIYCVSLSKQNKNLRANFGNFVTTNASVKLNQNASSVAVTMVLNNRILGVSYPQHITAECSNLLSESVVRVKCEIVCGKNKLTNLKLNTNKHWIAGEGGYYYYLKSVKNGDFFDICDAVEFPVDDFFNNEENSNVFLIITCETIELNSTIINSVWKNLPNDWLEQIIKQ